MDADDNQSPHLRHFVQTISSCGIWLLKPDGRIAQWNAGTGRLYGYQAGEVIGQVLATLFSAHEQQLGAPATALRLARRTGRAEPTCHRRRKDGSSFWTNACIDAVRDDAGELHCGVVINELVSNVLKHAFPENRGGEVEIDFKHGSASEVVLSVSDNGIGLPDSFNLPSASTLGMQLLSLLADQPSG